MGAGLKEQDGREKRQAPQLEALKVTIRFSLIIRTVHMYYLCRGHHLHHNGIE